MRIFSTFRFVKNKQKADVNGIERTNETFAASTGRRGVDFKPDKHQVTSN